jgi:beta-glucosidase
MRCDIALDKTQLKTIAVIGPNADSVEVMLGNYNGIPAQPITPLNGIRQKVEPEIDVLYVKGCHITRKIHAYAGHDYNEHFAAAIDIARRADVVIMVMGLSQAIEGEEGQQEGVDTGEASQGDRQGLDLPQVQDELLKTLYDVGAPIVLVMMNGSAVSVNWADEHLPAIIEAWYPGQAGGTALADVLFGDYNPAGRLPVTFYQSVDQLPPFTDYEMSAGRTHRYFKGNPLYPFGYGLSYTQFTYSDLVINPSQPQTDESVEVVVTVTNTGDRAGDEVVQLYVRDLEASVPVPVRQLAGFDRIHLQPGQAQTVRFTLKPEQFSLITDDGQRIVEPGQFEVAIGGGQPDFASGVLVEQIEISGEQIRLEP